MQGTKLNNRARTNITFRFCCTLNCLTSKGEVELIPIKLTSLHACDTPPILRLLCDKKQTHQVSESILMTGAWPCEPKQCWTHIFKNNFFSLSVSVL